MSKVDYVIVSADTAYDLQKKVREYIEIGYNPQGGVAAVIESGMRYQPKELYQAMIRSK